ncbi:SdpI family protein [Candidatus Parcubacteria bacterium]|nr:SdpI family protein [Candidatus Parcubacteria bacterium]
MNPIKPTIKTEILPVIIVILAIISSFYFYANFPEQVPIHWNVAGEVDNYGSKTLGAFLFPGIILGMYLMFLIIPYIDPKKKRYDQFRKVYHALKTVLVFFMAVMYFIASFNALGYNIRIELWIPIMVGALFILLGNYMSKIKPNWFMGIRTPWTLSSEEVWNKTHRVGGKVFILGGAMIASTIFVPVAYRMIIFFAAIGFIVVGTVIYSYIAYRQEEKNK